MEQTKANALKLVDVYNLTKKEYKYQSIELLAKLLNFDDNEDNKGKHKNLTIRLIEYAILSNTNNKSVEGVCVNIIGDNVRVSVDIKDNATLSFICYGDMLDVNTIRNIVRRIDRTLK